MCFEDPLNSSSARIESELPMNHVFMQVKYVVQTYARCNPRSGYRTSTILSSLDMK
jgi:hypothetical protein